MSTKFDVKKETENIIEYLRGYSKKYIIGMSGGKDSLVACALAVKAVGPENVLGLIMPNGVQDDLNDAIESCEFLKIKYKIVNIKPVYDIFENVIDESTGTARNYVSETNDPACLRTDVILSMTRRIGGMMINTCNRCEDVLGYSTFGGDNMGSVSPLMMYTTDEVIAIGDYLELPHHLVHKDPKDGMCGSSDEINLSRILNIPNFKYPRLCKLIRGEEHDFTDDEVKSIMNQYKKNKFKLDIIRIPHPNVDLFDYFLEF